jgi:hypothetical protein
VVHSIVRFPRTGNPATSHLLFVRIVKTTPTLTWWCCGNALLKCKRPQVRIFLDGLPHTLQGHHYLCNCIIGSEGLVLESLSVSGGAKNDRGKTTREIIHCFLQAPEEESSSSEAIVGKLVHISNFLVTGSKERKSSKSIPWG